MGCKKEVLVEDKLSKKLLSTTIVTLMLLASVSFVGMTFFVEEVQAGEGDGTICGWVKKNESGVPGDPIQGATVMINRTDQQQPPAFVITNATGEYIFDNNVSAGTYNITAHADGYQDWTYDGVGVLAGETKWVNFTLNTEEGGGPGGDMSLELDEYRSNVTRAYIQNGTESKFNFTIKHYMQEAVRVHNLTINLPTGFSYVGNNGTSLSINESANFTTSNGTDWVKWSENNSEGFWFASTEYFWFNATSTASLGSGSFNITAYGSDNTSQNISMTVFTTSNFSYSGTIKDADGQNLSGALASITVQSFGMNGPPITLGTFNALTDENGTFNITGIPTTEENPYNSSGGFGPGGCEEGDLFYQLGAGKYNDSSHNYAINISTSLPSISVSELCVGLQNPEIYLKPAISFRVRANGSKYEWNQSSQLPEVNYTDKTFQVMVKDQKLGFPVKEFTTQAYERIFSVAKGRNYSLSIFSEQSFPISIRFNDIYSTCENSNGNFDITGVTTSCTAYNGTYLVDVCINTSSSNKPLTGYFNNITSPLDMRVVAYTMEDQDMVFEDWALPYNLDNETMNGTDDVYNLSARTYNVTLPATQAPSYLMLRAYARNASGYYMGSHITNASNGNLNESNYNFTMYPLINGTSRSVSANNVSNPSWNDTTIVNTKAALFNLVNDTGSLLSTESPFIEVKRELEGTGTEYMQMISGSNGRFNISLLQGSSIKKLTIYSKSYAPISTPVSAGVLAGSSNTTTISKVANGTYNITMRSFGDFDPLNQSADFMMMMYTSNDSCNIPNPPQACSMCDPGDDQNGTDKDHFSPLKAILKGDISILIGCGNVSVYYLNVDLLASGPPDASFTTTGDEDEGGLASAWKFGSQGPEIYDAVLIGVPYSSNLSNSTIKVTIPLLYDNEYNVIWNASAGDTVSNISNDATLNELYGDYLNTPYEAYLNGTGIVCNESDGTLSSGLGYKDTENQTIWIKIPHFSGIGTNVTGLEPNPPSSFTATIFNETQINLTWSKGTNADYTYIERNNISSWTRGEGNGTYNGTGTSNESIGLTNGTVYYYQAWSWNNTNSLWSTSNASANNIPNPPSSFSASASSTSVIALTWSPGHNADYAYIEWNSTSGPWSRGEGTLLDNTTESTKSHTGLSSNTHYYYQAWSWNSTVGLWSTSNVTCSATTDSSSSSTPPPTTPTTEDNDTTTEIETTNTTKNEVENLYNISLEQNFSANDTDGDGMSDSFTDPNGILNAQHFVNISGNDTVLISVNETLDDLFIWDTTADTITQVTHNVGTITDTKTDVENSSITITVIVNKSNWIYIEVTDEHPDIFNLTVKTSDGRVISSDMIWRENGKIYVLDDPDTTYSFTYQYTILAPTFNPTSGTTFDTGKPTITITYTETVTVTEVTLNGESIDLTTTDNKTFAYVPGTNLTNGVYTLNITAQDADTNSRTDTATYTIDVELAESQSALPPVMMVAIIIAAIAAIAVIIILYKKKIF